MPVDLLAQNQSTAPQDLLAGIDSGASSAKAIAADAMNRSWGTGVPKAAYDLGGSLTDLVSKIGLPPWLAAGAGAALNVAPQAAEAFMSTPGKAALSAADLARNALTAQRANILQKGRELGIVVPPTQVNPSLTNLTLESMGGKAPTAQAAAARNEDVAYKVAQREAGLKPTESINLDTLKAARETMSQPYRDIAALESVGPLSQPPFKSPAETLEALKESRNNAKELWAYYNRSAKPDVLSQAKAASAKSDQLEEALAVQAADAGKPELAQALREARVALAKNHTVQRAMRGSSFDPSALSRLESRGSTPLSGDLETIMQMYRDFPKAMAAPQVGGSIGVHQLMPTIGASGGAVTGAILGGAHGASLGATAGVVGAQAIPPLMRALILSGPYQSLMANYGMRGGSALAPALLGGGNYGNLLRGALYPPDQQPGILAQP
jgi:hypothetical protein